MRLREILPADVDIAAGSADIDVGGITADSRATLHASILRRKDIYLYKSHLTAEA